MNTILEQLQQKFSAYAPNLLAAIAILVLGYLAALALAALAGGLLKRLSIDNKLANWMADKEHSVPVEKWCSKLVFYVGMLFVLIAFFSALKLDIITDPLQQLVGSFTAAVPKIIFAGILILVAWVLASVLRKVIGSVLQATGIDKRLGEVAPEAGKPGATPVSKTLGDAVYWMIFLLFLPLVLEQLELKALLDPLNAMIQRVLEALPNLLAAGLTFGIGWFVARIVQRLVSSLLASAGIDSASEKWGVASALGKRRLSEVIGLVIYVIILVPIVIAALDKLQMEAITRPASEMLSQIFNKIPELFGATLIMIIAAVVGRLVAGLISNILAGLGFNNVLIKLGLCRTPLQGARSPAAVVGTIVQIAILLFAAIAAVQTLGYDNIAVLIDDFIHFSGRVLLGLILFGLGLLLAQLVGKTLHTSDSARSRTVAWIARVTITVLVGAMALRATGVADSIINLAFGALVCGVALAGAIAFGWGGRGAAGQMVDAWKAKCDRPDAKP